ncbi:ComEC/Rec2 family competence protein [Flavobacterium sp.]|uniref:ComEC/Rec2 family competence protein n=1 Tax=Flavobacterium sp. TaxID=239 RepID=UPI00260F8B31|nr:ComEC/Rec2 family competence protein [Flavobacterium sp.]
MKVLQFPLVKVTLSFVLGIIFSHLIKPSYNTILIPLLSCFLLLIISYFFISKNQKTSIYFGLFTLLSSFFIGGFTLVSNIQPSNPNHYLEKKLDSENKYSFEVIISEKLKNTLNNDRYIAKVMAINEKKSYGKIILNIKKSNALSNIETGSYLKVNGTFYKNRNPFNPDQFDYGKYLENQQIYAQIYTDVSKIMIGSKVEKSLNYYASKLRNKIIHKLEKNNFNKRELSVVIALILGQQQDISKDIVRDYQYAGAVHVLSVSGLHVGFILIFVNFLLKPISNSKKGLTLKLIIVLISLWSFGILAGLAPSVVRSVTMFSFVAIGMFLRRSINIYHTLLVSALLILLFQPSFLFDIGFQLSYIALFFIVWFQPLLASIWTPKNKIANYFWEIITVSFAAQIGAFPISIYYFHQFPGLFFITNLIILPFLSFILALGVVVIVLAAFDIVLFPIMKLLEWSIWILNKIIAWVASFEDFILKDIPLNSYVMLSWYLVIFAIIIYLKKPNFKNLAIGLITIIVLQTSYFYANYSNQNTSEFIVFTKKKNTLITERKGNDVTLFANDSILNTTYDNLVLKSYLVANYCKLNEKRELSNLYYFKNKKIFLMDSTACYSEEIKPDILIITQSPKLNLERLFQMWKPKQVVVDASNFKSYVKIWEATCRKEKIPFHDTSEKGFYRLR